MDSVPNQPPSFTASNPAFTSEITIKNATPGGDMSGLPINYNPLGSGALAMSSNDDGSSGLINIGFDINFYGNTHNQLYINNNGNITFTSPLGQYTPSGFPQGTPIIAPFWADVDTRVSGEVRYSTGLSPRGNDFFQVDWINVGSYGGQNTAPSTFTLYIENQVAGDIVAFKFGDMGWTTGTASGGSGGFGGAGAQIGFDSGDGINYLSFGRPDSPESLLPFSNKTIVFRIGETGTPSEVYGEPIVIPHWAIFNPGSESESDQLPTYYVTKISNPSLFAITPSVSPDGTLVYLPALNAYGTSTFTVVVRDSGGTEGGGTDTSEPQDFGIQIVPVNDAPSFTASNPEVVNEDAGSQTINKWATFNPGAPNESDQTATYSVTDVSNPSLFSELPSVDSNGTLTYTPAPDAYGTSTFTVIVRDSGGTENAGHDTSEPQTFTITVNPVNDAPSFTASDPAAVNEDSGTRSILNWATFNPGSASESGQSATYFVYDVSNPALFSDLPSVDGNGTLTYTPAHNAYGTSTFTVMVRDSGGTENGGVDSSGPQTFTITVNPVNDAPVIGLVSTDVPWLVRGNPVTVTASNVTDIDSNVERVDFYQDVNRNGLVDAADKLLGTASSQTDGKWSAQIPTADIALGNIALLAVAVDDGGKANGGTDTSTPVGTSFNLWRVVQQAAKTNFIQYIDANGNTVKATLTGPGSIEAFFDTEGKGNATRLELDGTTTKSSLNIAVTKAKTSPVDNTTIGDVVVNGALISFGGAKVNLTGDFTSSGHIKTLAIGDINSDKQQTVSIAGTSSDKTTITAGRLADVDYKLEDIIITSFKALEWLDNNGVADSLTGFSLGSFATSGKAATRVGTTTVPAVAGDMQADIVLTQSSTGKTAPSVSTFNVAGSVEANLNLGVHKLSTATVKGDASGFWDSNVGGFGALNINGNATGLSIHTQRDVGSVNIKGQGLDVMIFANGSVGAVSSANWLGGAISANKVTSISTKGLPASKTTPAVAGDFTGMVEIKAVGLGNKVNALNNASISGRLSGNWSINGKAGPLSFGSVEDGEVSALSDITSFTSKGTVENFTLKTESSIGAVTSANWLGGAIMANKVTSISTKGMAGSKTTPAVSGDFTGEVDIMANGLGNKIVALNNASISGVLSADWAINGKTGALSFGSVNGGAVSASGDIASFMSKGSVDGLVLTANNLGAVTSANWLGGSINANKVTSISTKGLVGGKGVLPLAGDFSGEVKIMGEGLLNKVSALNNASVSGRLSGNWSINGKAGPLSFGSVDNAMIEASSDITSFISKGSVHGLSLSTDGSLGTVTALNWMGGSILADKITGITISGKAGSRGVAAISGDFIGDVTVTGEGVGSKAPALGNVNISGAMAHGNWRIDGNTGNFSVGAMMNSTLFVGVSGTVSSSTMPTSKAQFTNPQATLAGFTVTGKAVANPNTTPTFANSRIAAGVLTKVSLRRVDLETTQDNGFAAASRIVSYTRQSGPLPVNLVKVNNQSAPGTYDPVAATEGYRLRIVGA